MRICVYGAGAIGGHLAGRLAKGGAEVSVAVRGPILAAIRANGLRILAPDGELHSHPHATDDAATIGPVDAVLVTAKAPALASVAAGISQLLGPDTPVLFVLSGIPWWYFDSHGGAHDGRRLPVLDPDETIRRAIGPARTLGGVVYSACEVREPGVVEVENPNSRLVIGEPNGQLSARLEAIAAPLRAGGLNVQIADRIRDAIWSKLLGNICSGPLAVITRSAPRDFRAEHNTETMLTLHNETLAGAQALGCTPQVDLTRLRDMTRAMTHRPSILQDLLRGRPMEIDGIYATPVELARMAGIATPMLDLMVAVVKVRAREAGLYNG